MIVLSSGNITFPEEVNQEIILTMLVEENSVEKEDIIKEKIKEVNKTKEQDNIEKIKEVFNTTNNDNIERQSSRQKTLTSRGDSERLDKQNKDNSLFFIRPLDGGYISSNYGYRGSEFHTGVDICIKKNTPILATEDGVIDYVGWQGGYGKLVIIKHASGYQSYYAHCSNYNVTQGQEVKKKDVIAYVGTTGRSTGYHLHFEIRKDGEVLNPNNFIQI